MKDESSVAGRPATRSLAQPPSESWCALRAVCGKRFPVLDETVLRLLRILSQPMTAQRTRQLLDLARSDVSWAGWLIAMVRPLRSRDSVPVAESFPPVAQLGAPPPHDWLAIESQVVQMIDDCRFPNWLRAAFSTVEMEPAKAEKWWVHRHRVQQLAQQMVQGWWPDQRVRRAVFWWTLALADQVDSGALSEAELPSDGERQWRQFVTRLRRVADQFSCCPPTGKCPAASPAVAELVGPVLARYADLERLECRFIEEVEQEKLAAMKELAYGASHEINNPLANISSRAQMLLRGERNAERRRSLETINSQAFRAHEMIADMMLFAKPPALEAEWVEWSVFCSDVLQALEKTLPPGIELRVATTNRRADVHIDKAHVSSAIQAIWRNACEVMGDRGVMSWRVAIADAAPAESQTAWAELEICDSGPGISHQVRRHLLDPFFSGRESGRGLGLGLSKAWRIVQQHAGQLIVGDGAEQMTSLTLRLPVGRNDP